jgi:outer membrane protein TolC
MQGVERLNTLLDSIESHNTTLAALRQSVEAEKIGNRTDIYLPGPDVEFNYLWGNNGIVGNRKDFKLTQSFDYATISGKKSRVADAKNQLVELQYKGERLNVILEAKQLYMDIVYCNAMLKELGDRHEAINDIIAMQKRRLDSGEGSQIELNSALMSEATIIGEESRITAEKTGYLSELARLNGGIAVNVETDSYDVIYLPANFDDWYAVAAAKNPALAYVQQDIKTQEENVALAKSENLPTLTAGYMSESTVGETYRGITLGLSIPLWSNKNKVRQAKAESLAAQLRAEDAKQQFYGSLLTLYRRTAALKEATERYRTAMTNANNTALLKKALDAGKLTMIEFLTESNLYYTAFSDALATERDYQKAFAELTVYE